MERKTKKVALLLSALLATTSLSTLAADKTLYRAYKHGNHFYTTNVTEMLNAVGSGGFTYEGPAVILVSYDDSDANKAFYRMHNPNAGPGGNHFYTSDVNEALNIKSLGYEYESTEGYTTHSQAKTIYRGFNSELVNHFYTADVVEMLNATSTGGYVYEKEEGYGK
ncbi:hypothetical protein [Pseudoalteromonas luteoviolacea]|uniref:DUF5648 domain-containing protein n=1 Tax=Pseudoalteromonas luteoviolacea S4054 TaxID=1129367 RepID=A0A0F6AFI1_9GAMM|nr:hypothetical protein [Pseudoalteromonas luteoviolacea]AOT07856.1 hypothetical protein S4054249_08390 [Pseudoalteromonas luteoviolacea]AOT12772.1 hypothetical protein S40542_08390 [Pseudoalteromonas luteoviolacea]AOT17685.1 hypothetical protein S4054_08385 [Pseudoalteromonas luteoviolacea]KKE84965.1 hypothetical protein N479_26280 [Pseudoalteromonas luteoviolacea S4054]KZN77894.1 hypothetical protein N481_26240 [Pseudoalteromonas luteoviolacea S4047-1]